MIRSVLLCGAVLLAACSPPAATTPPAETTTPAAAAPAASQFGVTIEAPLANARVTSPIVARGVAPNSYYFEAVFPVRLIGADGRVIAEAPGQAQSPWTTPGPVAFIATVPFQVSVDTPATLVLAREVHEGATPYADEIRIPVVLTPSR